MEDKKDRYWDEIGDGRPDKTSNLTIQPRSIIFQMPMRLKKSPLKMLIYRHYNAWQKEIF